MRRRSSQSRARNKGNAHIAKPTTQIGTTTIDHSQPVPSRLSHPFVSHTSAPIMHSMIAVPENAPAVPRPACFQPHGLALFTNLRHCSSENSSSSRNARQIFRPGTRIARPHLPHATRPQSTKRACHHSRFLREWCFLQGRPILLPATSIEETPVSNAALPHSCPYPLLRSRLTTIF